jgi:hypothetical protein
VIARWALDQNLVSETAMRSPGSRRAARRGLRPAHNPTEGVFQLKRPARTAAAIVALLLLLPAGAAATGGDTTVDRVPGDFVLTSQDCRHLPPATTITGTGTGTSVTRTTTHRGITTIANRTIIPGTATDQAGNRYRFLYINHFRVSNTKAQPTVFSGRMEDVFFLGGRGPARLSNGFIAVYTTNFADLNRFDPISAFGDPITFPTGEGPHCDPL